MSHTHKDENEWKRERNERAAREHFRKISDGAQNRMLTRSAKAQLEDAMKRNREPVPDADDESYKGF
jgi:hypothetical protein